MKRPTTAELQATLERDPIQAVRLAVATFIAASHISTPAASPVEPVEVATDALRVADALIARTIAAPAS